MASFASAQSEQNESVDTAVIFPASSADLAAAGLSANSDVFGDHQAALEQDNGVYGPQYPAGADAMDDLDADVPMDIQVEESMINTAQVVDAGRTEEGAGESAIHSDEAEPLDTTLQGEGKRVKVRRRGRGVESHCICCGCSRDRCMNFEISRGTIEERASVKVCTMIRRIWRFLLLKQRISLGTRKGRVAFSRTSCCLAQRWKRRTSMLDSKVSRRGRRDRASLISRHPHRMDRI